MRSHEYIGRGSKQRGHGRSILCSQFKVSAHGRALATEKFLETFQRDEGLRKYLSCLSGMRLVCHCFPAQACHADCKISGYRLMYPPAYDREKHRGTVPSSDVLNRVAQLRLDPDSDVGSSPDEDCYYPAGSDRVGTGSHYKWDRAVRVVMSAMTKYFHPLDAGQWSTAAIQKTHVGQASLRSTWISLALFEHQLCCRPSRWEGFLLAVRA